MTVYSINYTLHEPNQEYEDLHEAIKSYPGWCHILDACWLVSSSNTSASDIRDDLKEHVSGNDKILVMEKGSSWATTFSNDCTDWLHNH